MKKTALIFFLTLAIPACKAQSLAFEWAKQLGAHYEEHSNAIAIDTAGNVYTAGFFQGPVDFDPGPGTYMLSSSGNEDAFISKLDAAGNFIWAKKMGGAFYDDVLSIAVDLSGNVYATGAFQDTSDFDPGPGVFNLISLTPAKSEIFILKLDVAGNFVWAKQMNGAGWNIGTAIALDAAGNVYATGNFTLSADFNPGTGNDTLTAEADDDVFILKLDATGNFVWVKQFRGYSNDESAAITIDISGSVLTTGYYNSSDTDFDPGPGVYSIPAGAATGIFVSKLDAAGNFAWAKKLGNGGIAADIITDDSANVYTTGYYIWQGDFDPGPDTFQLISNWGPDVYISKLDASGNFVWAKGMGGGTFDAATSIALDAPGNVYTTGRFEGTADFDPGAATFSLSPSGGKDVFISELDSAGNFVWAGQLGGSSDDYSTAMAVGLSGNVYTSGFFAGTCDFDPEPLTLYNLSCSGGNSDVFIQKMKRGPVFVNDLMPAGTFSVYPNPAGNTIQLDFGKALVKASIRVTDLAGQIVLEENDRSGTVFSLDVSSLASGIYILRVNEDGYFSGMRFVKQ